MADRHGRSRSGSARKRVPSWSASATTGLITIAAGATSISVVFTNAVLNAAGYLGATLVRTRGVFHAQSDQQAAVEAPVLCMGMMFVTEEAAAAGAVPSPFTDADADWFVWETVVPSANTGAGTQVSGSVRKIIDSKAMRKVDDQSSLILVVENVDAAAGALFSFSTRMLFKRA